MSDKAAAVALMVLAACGPEARELVPDAPLDAAPDAYAWDPGYEPITVTGYTPAGSVQPLQFIYARYAGAWCSDSYEIELSPTRLLSAERYDPYLVISIPMSSVATEPATGPLPASAVVWRFDPRDGAVGLAATEEITFEAELLQPPTVAHGTVRGRIVTTAPGWMLDFSVDLVSVGHYSCW